MKQNSRLNMPLCEKVKIKKDIFEGRSVHEIMSTHNISEWSFYRIKKGNIAEGIENKEQNRLRKNTKYGKINEWLQ